VAITQQSHFVQLAEQQTLHLRRIANDEQSGPVVFLMHGAVENGKIFYTHSNKGLAPFLAEQGYCCYVADLRGRGESKPLITRHSKYGQTEAIVEDIPAFIDHIEQLEGKKPDYWVAHSWGGVLMNSVFARFPEYLKDVKACAYFGSKRSLFNNHPKKLLPSLPLYDIHYKQIVAEPESQLSALFSFLGCEYEPQCLAFYKRKAAVSTLSKQAIRQPINTQALAHWERYKTPLLKQFE